MTSSPASRRSFLTLALATPLTAAALTSCGGSSGPGEAPEGGASMWILTGQPGEGIRTDAVDAFNAANEDAAITLTAFQNDAYKTKIRTAMGADQAPTILPSWGGGGLRDYVRNDKVEDLTDFFEENTELRDSLFPSAFAAATVDDRIYAVPCEAVTPIVFYYNKAVFEQVGAQPPTTWDELLALVPVFNDAGIAPIALGGQSRWTNMMWLEYLYDRIGGAELFQSIYDGEPDAWSQPASIDALTKTQELVRAGGFVTGFASIAADTNADQALLYTGRAAMMLHGAWTYGSMKADGGEFVTGGDLGWMTFPSVEGGVGDPSATVGNPSGYYAVAASATDAEKEAAKKFLAEGLVTDATTQAWIDNGSVPIVLGSDSLFQDSEDAEWLQFVYDLASGASTFQQSWDQALSPTAADKLLENIEKLFNLSITRQMFAENLNTPLLT
ncbi:extracellular solute-binding protein [Kineococcus terrestris]|uniref:extracellular solute-binding protein n=1 Tax=Kineococcus terrestris TaxID=2044856 RepID=UPI0034DB366B